MKLTSKYSKNFLAETILLWFYEVLPLKTNFYNIFLNIMVVCIVLNDGIFLLFMAYLSQDEAKNYTYYFTPEFLQ